MTSGHSPDELLAALQQYLRQTDFADLAAADQPDLAALFSDLAGLKTEVKAESRRFKAALDTLSEAVAQLKSDNQALTAELAAAAERMRRQRLETERAMLLDWLDIYDRLAEGVAALQNYRPGHALFNHSKKRDVRFIDSLAQGQAITLQRFEQTLLRRKVYPLACVGKAFDAGTMNAVAIAGDPEYGNGIVLAELRKGFMFEDQVLRLAEVKVNKR